MADDGGLVGGWQAPPRGPADEESLQTAVAAAVEAEAAELRATVDAGLRDLAARADEILGGGLGDLAIRFGEQLKSLQTAAATSHDDRRIDAQTANRVRAMEERLDLLIARLDSDAPVAPAVPAQAENEQVRQLEATVESVGRRLSDQLDRGVGRATSRVDEVEVRSRQLEEVVLRLESTVAGIAEVIGDGGSAGDVAAVVERMSGVEESLAARVGELEATVESVGRRLSDQLDRGVGRATSRVDEVEVRSRQLEEVVLRLESTVAGIAEAIGDGDGTRSLDGELERTREAVIERIESLSETFDDVVERVDVLEQLFTLIVEGDPQREAEQRRQLIADFARAMNGHLCAECGYVAETARGLASHERVHSTGSGGETDQ